MYIYIWLCDNCQLWQLRYDDDVKWEVLSLYYIDCDLPWYPCLGFAWQSSVSQELYIYMYICISIYISNDSAFSIYLRHKNWEWLDSLTPRQNGSVERKRLSHWHEMSFAKWLVWGLQTLRKHHPNFWCYTTSWPPWQGRAALALSCKQR